MAKMVKIMDTQFEYGSEEWKNALDQHYKLHHADRFVRWYCQWADELGVDPGTAHGLAVALGSIFKDIPDNLTYKQYLRIGADLCVDDYGRTRFTATDRFEWGWNHHYSSTLLIRRVDDVVLVWSRSVDCVTLLAYDQIGDLVDVDRRNFDAFLEIERDLDFPRNRENY